MAINSQSLSKEQVLIVGCGDIGRRLVQYLPRDTYQITGLRRHPPADTDNLTYLRCDVASSEALGQALESRPAVILITMTPDERSDAGYERAYVRTCTQLVTQLHKQSWRPRLVIFVSSTAVYHQDDGSWVDENSPTHPDSFSGRRLLEAERIISEGGFPAVVLRFSGIYGPGRTRLLEQVRLGKASAGESYTNRIHAEDCARAIAYLIQYGKQQPLESLYLATDSTPATMLDVVSFLAEPMGVNPFSSGNTSNERSNKRCRNSRLLDTGFSFLYPDFKSGYAPLIQDYLSD